MAKAKAVESSRAQYLLSCVLDVKNNREREHHRSLADRWEEEEGWWDGGEGMMRGGGMVSGEGMMSVGG